jgi:RNA polymerase sigma-70 factor (ECF subfamily)
MTSALINSHAVASVACVTETPTQALDSPAENPASGVFGTIEACYAEHSPRIFRFLLASLRDRDLAASLTQDTFVRAWAARSQFRGECAISTWLTRIALNLLRDHTRTDRFRFWKQVGQTAVQADDMAAHLPHQASSTEAALIAHQQMQLVWKTVATLSQRQRTVFLLRFVEEMDLADISIATGLPISTVKTHLYRSLATVRRHHSATQPRRQQEPR